MFSGERQRGITLLLFILIFASLIWLVSCDNNIYLPDNDTWAVQDMYFSNFSDAVSWLSSQDTPRAIVPEERTIRLMRDVSGSENAGSIIVPSTFKGVLKIDFDGHEYCFGTRANSFVEINGGDVVIVDEKIVIPGNSQSEKNAMAVNGASVTINGISIDDRRPAPQALYVGTGGNLVIESSVSGDSSPVVEGSFSLAAGGSLEIRGGVIKVDKLSVEGEASLEISGGVVYYSHGASELIVQAVENGGGKAVGVTVHDISDWITDDPDVHYKECAGCHEHFEESVHSFSAWSYDPSAGKTSRTCSVCGRTETLDHNHAMVRHYPVEKTCTSDGSTGYWYCPECGLKFSDSEGLHPLSDSDVVIPASHSLVHVDYSPATCTVDGMMEHYMCSDCGMTFRDADAKEEFNNIIIYASHQMTHHAPVLPTCTEDGNIEYWECSVCEKVFSDQLGHNEINAQGLIIPKTGHSLVKRDAVAATCTSTGTIEYWICSVCGKLFSDVNCNHEISLSDIVVPRLAHTAVRTAAVEPTCTSSGNSEYWTCSVCGKHFSDAQCTTEIAADSWIIPALGHSISHVASVAATCTSEGRVEYWSCSECGKLFSDAGCTDEITLSDTVVQKLAHTTVRTAAVAPTCTLGGNSEYWTCTVCGKHFSDQACTVETTLEACVIPAIGHAFQHVGAVAATCLSEGTAEHWHCTVCGKDYSDSQGNNEILSTVVPMVSHELEHHVAVAATCTADGVAEYWSCSECCRLFSDSAAQNMIAEPAVLGKTGHSMEHVYAVSATCTSTGIVEHWHCTVCGRNYADSQGTSELVSTVAPMAAHDLVHHEAVAATCTSAGSIEYWECSSCGLRFADGNGSIVVQSISTPIIEHSPVHHDAVSATCTTDGTVEHWSCSVCGGLFSDARCKNPISISDTVVESLGHSLVYHPETNSSCIVHGNIAYYECTVCGDRFSDSNGLHEINGSVEKALAEHVLSDWVATDSTSHYKVCSVCGGHFNVGEHEFAGWHYDAEKDLEVNECSVCNRVIEKNHSHVTEFHPAVSHTCTEDGTIAYYECVECERKYIDSDCTIEILSIVDPAAHSPVHHDAVIPTCTSLGSVEYWSCSECGKLFSDSGCTDEITLSDTIVQRLAHTVVRTSAVEPTCTLGGNSEYWTCTVCGKHFSDALCAHEIASGSWVLAAKGHTFNHVDAVASTCVSEGTVEHWHCTVCGKDYADSQGNNEILSTVVPMVAHELEHHAAVAAICTTDGVAEYWSCSVCGRLFNDAGGHNMIAEPPVLERTGHRLDHVDAVTATCTATGVVEHWHCTVCGKNYSNAESVSELVSTVAPMAAHDLDHHGAVAATCTSAGSIEYWECSSCGLRFADGNGSIVVQSISTPIIEHSPVHHDAVSATCTTDGTVEHWSCSVCGGLFSDARCKNPISISDTVVESLGHSLVYHPETNSSCIVHGNIAYYECTVCGDRFSDSNGLHEINGSVEKALAEHVLSDWVATDSTSHYKVCSVCGGHFNVGEHEFAGWHYDAEKDLEVNECSVCNRVIEKNHSHVTEFHPAVSHTCTEDGTIAYYECVECERKYIDSDCTIEILSIVDPAAHSPVHHDAVIPTCTSLGSVEYWSCSECGKLFSDSGCTDEITLSDTIVQRLAHTVVRTSAVEPTCTLGGNSEYWTCTVCGKHFSDALCAHEIASGSWVLAAKGHTFNHVDAVASTCVSEGTVEHWHCTVCGKDYADSQGNNEILSTVVPMVAHELEHHAAVAAICTTDGVAEYWSCSVCGRLFNDAGGHNMIAEPPVLERTGHRLDHVDAVTATCTATGVVEHWHCTVCGKNYSNAESVSELVSTVAPMVAHDLMHHEAVAATCTSAGSIEYWECSVCGKHYSDSQGKTEIDPRLIVIGATGHNLSHVERVEATCTSSGVVEHWRCSVCGNLFSDINAMHIIDPESVVIPAKGHSAVGTAAVEATCTSAGSSAYWTCSECGKHFSDASCTHEIAEGSWVVAAKGHNLVHVNAVAATCTTDGVLEHWHCTVCGKDYSDASGQSEMMTVTVPASGHSPVVTAAKAATCTEDGNTTYWTCTVCGKHYSDERCIEEIEELSWVIAKHGHSLTEINAVEATCTASGIVGHWHCSECGHDFSDSNATDDITGSVVVQALGHSIVSTPATSPTCTEPGNSSYWACTRCGTNFSDALCTHEIASGSWVIPATGHSYSIAFDDNRHWHECEKCGDVKEEESHVWGDIEVCPDGHHFVRRCTVCGAVRNEDVSKYTEIQTGIGVILVPNAISSPCGSIKAEWVGNVCHVSFVPNINSSDDYGIACYLLTGGYVRLSADESGEFTFTDSGRSEYRIQVQAYNGGGTNTYEKIVPRP